MDAISIHAPREGCDLNYPLHLKVLFRISIHAPREGCDGAGYLGIWPGSQISIHAPREGCDFLLVLRRIDHKDFNPRTPRGVRPVQFICVILIHNISIHAPREGCDECVFVGITGDRLFQSTHPARGATLEKYALLGHSHISIHAPREGCDVRSGTVRPWGRLFQSTHPARGATWARMRNRPPWANFNPRTPRGVRPDDKQISQLSNRFQSTHPARGATAVGGLRRYLGHISIHAPREGCDHPAAPEHPRRQISIHAPREGCDRSRPWAARTRRYFNPRTPRGVRHFPV